MEIYRKRRIYIMSIHFIYIHIHIHIYIKKANKLFFIFITESTKNSINNNNNKNLSDIYIFFNITFFQFKITNIYNFHKVFLYK